MVHHIMMQSVLYLRDKHHVKSMISSDIGYNISTVMQTIDNWTKNLNGDQRNIVIMQLLRKHQITEYGVSLKLTKKDKIHIFEEWILEDKCSIYLNKK